MKDKELEKYYDTYRELFSNSGWKLLLEDLIQNANVINSVEACKSGDDLQFRKGQLSIIANMLNLESQIKAAEAQAEESETEELSEAA